MTERIVSVNGAKICTESFGDPAGPPVLLVMGVGGSMLWWDDAFCGMLAERGRFVIRYDHRDTGRSVTYDIGRAGYTAGDLIADAAGVLDVHGVEAAHVVGVSAGGAFAQLLALDAPERVLSLVLVSTSPAVPGDRSLPPPNDELMQFVRTAKADWSDPRSVEEYLVAYSRVLSGSRRPFDETAARALVHRDMERADRFAAVQNHDAIPDDDRRRGPLSAIGAPTLVVHGSADPMFPIEHGEALAREIPRARLLRLADAGHGVDRADWPTLVDAIAEHTGRGTQASISS